MRWLGVRAVDAHRETAVSRTAQDVREPTFITNHYSLSREVPADGTPLAVTHSEKLTVLDKLSD